MSNLVQIEAVWVQTDYVETTKQLIEAAWVQVDYTPGAFLQIEAAYIQVDYVAAPPPPEPSGSEGSGSGSEPTPEPSGSEPTPEPPVVINPPPPPRLIAHVPTKGTIEIRFKAGIKPWHISINGVFLRQLRANELNNFLQGWTLNHPETVWFIKRL